MQSVLDRPVVLDGFQEVLGRHLPAHDVGAGLITSVSAAGLLMREQFPGIPGILEPVLRVLAERPSVALKRFWGVFTR